MNGDKITEYHCTACGETGCESEMLDDNALSMGFIVCVCCGRYDTIEEVKDAD